MKRYKTLSVAAKEDALDKAVEFAYLRISQLWRSEFPSAEANAAVDEALAEAESMQTPWFAAEYVRDATFITNGETFKLIDYITDLCKGIIEDAWYPEPGDIVISGVAGW